jgi:hypothetical protein
MKVPKEERQLPIQRRADGCRRFVEGARSAGGIIDPHRADLGFRFAVRSFLMSASIDAENSSAVLNGQRPRPAAYSLSLWAMLRLIARRSAGVYSSSALGTIVTTPSVLSPQAPGRA